MTKKWPITIELDNSTIELYENGTGRIELGPSYLTRLSNIGHSNRVRREMHYFMWQWDAVAGELRVSNKDNLFYGNFLKRLSEGFVTSVKSEVANILET
jgi:hypothetical protein